MEYPEPFCEIKFTSSTPCLIESVSLFRFKMSDRAFEFKDLGDLFREGRGKAGFHFGSEKSKSEEVMRVKLVGLRGFLKGSCLKFSIHSSFFFSGHLDFARICFLPADFRRILHDRDEFG